jgi:N-acetylneuraminate lyase
VTNLYKKMKTTIVWITILLTLGIAAARAVTPLRVDGLVAATFTPFDENFKVDASIVPQQAAYLNATGVKYVFVSGTTGESVKLTTTERLNQAQAWVTAAKQYNLKTIIHVGAESLEDAKVMAANAVSIGADAIAAMPPSFFK